MKLKINGEWYDFAEPTMTLGSFINKDLGPMSDYELLMLYDDVKTDSLTEPGHSPDFIDFMRSCIAFELGKRGMNDADFLKRFVPKSGTTMPIAADEVLCTRILKLHKEGQSNLKIQNVVMRGRNAIGKYINQHCDCPKCELKRTKPL